MQNALVEHVTASFAQQRLWFLDQYEPATSLYNMPEALRVEGNLDCAALERSLNEVVCRHESLRTTFATLDELPVQVIARELRIPLQLVDLSDHVDAEAQAERLARQEAGRPFDLERGPLLRAGVIKIAERAHLFLLTLHHIVSDGWSMQVLMREICALYAAFSRGEASPLPELPIQYADYAVWERDWVRGEVLQEQLDYWKKVLHGAPSLLELPTDRPRSRMRRTRGDAIVFETGIDLSARLKRLSQRMNATPFMTFAAAFTVILQRYSAQDDICIGYPVANRNRPETEGLVGLFVNTQVLRARVRGDDTFEALLGRVRECVLDGDAHRDLPFERLVEELRPQRSVAYSPLFQVMLSVQDDATGGGPLQLCGLNLRRVPIPATTSKFDLTLNIIQRGDRFEGLVEYSTDLFDRETLERMAGHFCTVLDAAVRNPAAKVRDLPLLTASEVRQFSAWNDTAMPFRAEKCIQELFEEQVERQPDAVAVACGEAELTYRELDARANQVAHCLRELGTGPDVLVALCMERSLAMVVGLLGVLKAGGAYVPLDPGHPAERLGYMLADTHAPVVLTQHALKQRLPTTTAKVLCLDSDWQEHFSGRSERKPGNTANPANLAYCIYTSGSTGRPKGVLIEQSALNAYLHWSASRYLPGVAISLVSSPISFDLTITSLLAPLVHGVRVALSPPVSDLDRVDLPLPPQPGRCLLKMTPAHLMLVSAHAESALRSVRAIVGGEQLTATDAAQFAARVRDGELINEYGPTETVVGCTTNGWSGEGTVHGNVPIGRPISNARIYILDAWLNRVPVGVRGEIHIAGEGVARGYLNRPELTAEKFIPDPFGRPGGRMYKSGDVGRYLPDGNIEFLGRLDNQVKIRGYRIELGEVENALLRCEGVLDAAVTAREDVPGERHLAAYVVPESGRHPAAAELRRKLQQSVPEYMVPTAWVFLDAMPLNANGKVDRKALPAPSAARDESVGEYLAPRTKTERLLADIWAEVLKVDRIGIDDDFFALGGHSLLALRVLSRFNGITQARLSLVEFIAEPTIRRIAAKADTKTHNRSRMATPQILKSG